MPLEFKIFSAVWTGLYEKRCIHFTCLTFCEPRVWRQVCTGTEAESVDFAKAYRTPCWQKQHLTRNPTWEMPCKCLAHCGTVLDALLQWRHVSCVPKRKTKNNFILFIFDTNDSLQRKKYNQHRATRPGERKKRGKAQRTRERPRTRPRQAGEPKAKKRKTIQGLASKSCDCTDKGFNTQLQHPAWQIAGACESHSVEIKRWDLRGRKRVNLMLT